MSRPTSSEDVGPGEGDYSPLFHEGGDYSDDGEYLGSCRADYPSSEADLHLREVGLCGLLQKFNGVVDVRDVDLRREIGFEQLGFPPAI